MDPCPLCDGRGGYEHLADGSRLCLSCFYTVKVDGRLLEIAPTHRSNPRRWVEAVTPSQLVASGPSVRNLPRLKVNGVSISPA